MTAHNFDWFLLFSIENQNLELLVFVGTASVRNLDWTSGRLDTVKQPHLQTYITSTACYCWWVYMCVCSRKAQDIYFTVIKKHWNNVFVQQKLHNFFRFRFFCVHFEHLSIISLLTCQSIIRCPWLQCLDPPTAHQTHRHGTRGATPPHTQTHTPGPIKLWVQRETMRKARDRWTEWSGGVSSVTLTGIKGLEEGWYCLSHTDLHPEASPGSTLSPIHLWRFTSSQVKTGRFKLYAGMRGDKQMGHTSLKFTSVTFY